MADKTRDPSKPLKNPKWEKFIMGLLEGRSRSEAYSEAGYKCNKEQSRKQAERLMKTNEDVLGRYNYLIEKHNKELEKRGIISRERMLVKGIKLLDVAMGETVTKIQARGSDGEYYTEELKLHDVKGAVAIWDKLMVALDFYPNKKQETELKPISVTIKKASDSSGD